MTWTDPAAHVFVTGEIVAAATLNTYVKDDLIDLDRRTSPTENYVAASQTTGSNTFNALSTAGPAASVVIGALGKCLVSIYSLLANSVAEYSLMSYQITGASTVAANDAWAIQNRDVDAITVGAVFVHPGLTPGSTTFTALYRVTGTSTGTFQDRRITVTPLGA